jgi:hypothetical protein
VLPLLTGLALQAERPQLIVPERKALISAPSLILPERRAKIECPEVIGMFPFPSPLMGQAVAGGGTPATFVGSKTFTFASTSATACSLTDLLTNTGTTATLLQNDFVLVVIDTNTPSAPDITFTPPAGWTQECDLYQADTSAVNMAVWSKFMGASPDSSVLIQGANAALQAVCVTVHAFRGVNTTTPRDVANVTAVGQNDGKPNPGAITPVTAGALIYVAGAAAVGGSGVGGVFTNPGDLNSGTNEFASANRSATSQSGVSGAGFVAWNGAGAFDPATWGGGRTNTACSWAALTMALRPA